MGGVFSFPLHSCWTKLLIIAGQHPEISILSVVVYEWKYPQQYWQFIRFHSVLCDIASLYNSRIHCDCHGKKKGSVMFQYLCDIFHNESPISKYTYNR